MACLIARVLIFSYEVFIAHLSALDLRTECSNFWALRGIKMNDVIESVATRISVKPRKYMGRHDVEIQRLFTLGYVLSCHGFLSRTPPKDCPKKPTH